GLRARFEPQLRSPISLGKLAGPSAFATVRAFLAGSALLACTALFAACNGGGTSGSTNTISSAVQDLTVDPSGQTTVLTFASTKGLASAGIANFLADHGQSATSAIVAADTVTVVWDARVSPATMV